MSWLLSPDRSSNPQITAEQWEEFHGMGDVNRDGVINEKDKELIEAAWYSVPGDPNWNPDADLNGDGVITVGDAAILGAHWGLTIWEWTGVPPPPKIPWKWILSGLGVVAFAAIMATRS